MIWRQFSYFLFPEDILEIEKYLINRWDVLFVKYRTNDIGLKYVNSLVWDYFGNSVMLVKSSQTNLVKTEFISTRNYYLIDSNSPTIEIDVVKSLEFPEYLKIGRLYYQPRFFLEWEWISQNEEFIKWAEKIYRDIKKMFKLWKGVYYHRYGKNKDSTLELKEIYLSERAIEYIKNGGELNFF